MAIRESLSLSDDQRDLQDNVRAFLGDQLSSAELRGSLDGETGYNPDLHARLAGELGLCGLTIPREFGGLGMSQVEASVVHAELGRALYPGPFLPSWLAAGVLLASGDREACEHWLPLLADGSVTGTVAAADEAGHWSSGSDSVRAELTDGGWQLSGRRWYVITGHVAGIVVIPAVTESGLAMFLVEPGSPGFAISRQLSFDLTRRISIISLDATPAVLLSQDAAAALGRAEHEFLLAGAAEAAGGISWCLDASIAYVKDRERFGSPAGSFEVIAHSCVDMLEDLQSVSSAARYAAAATADGAPEAPMAARVAALRAGEAYRDVTEAAMHLFGGIGFTWEQDAHLHYRRAWSAERLAGGPQAHREAIADLAPRLSRQPIRGGLRVTEKPRRCGQSARSRYASCVPVAARGGRKPGRIAQW
jgi:alkylation response protein AidB-like acyl-CoA dehydrogenase